MSRMRIPRGLLRVLAGLFAVAALSTPALVNGPTATAVVAFSPSSSLPSGTLGHKIIFPAQASLSSKSMSSIIGNDGVGPAVATEPPLTFGGGNDGIGVMTGQPAVYLIFWGSQWGVPTAAGNYVVPSIDANNVGLRLEQMYAGMGTNGELWSGVMTQYCEGVAAGATTCPSIAAHVAYPSGNGVLAGVWIDNASPAPDSALAQQLGEEAIAAAGHFGNISSALDRDAQYVIVSPTGTHPDSFNTIPLTSANSFCAWHSSITSTYGDIAFTNMPYVLDVGSHCGENFVNSGAAGTLDGVTIVAGHEYAETLTDEIPSGGWTDASGSEDADKCIWIPAGTPGGAANVAFAPGGVVTNFAMQATWSNATANCAISSPIVTTSTSTSTSTTTTVPVTTTTVPVTTTTVPVTTTTVPVTTTTVPVTTTTAPVTTTTVPVTTTTVPVTTTTVPVTTTTLKPIVTLLNPGTLKVKVKTAYRHVLVATDSQDGYLSLTSSGLPHGLSISSSTRAISGSATRFGTYRVSVRSTDLSGDVASVSFSMIVNTTGLAPKTLATSRYRVIHKHRAQPPRSPRTVTVTTNEPSPSVVLGINQRLVVDLESTYWRLRPVTGGVVRVSVGGVVKTSTCAQVTGTGCGLVRKIYVAVHRGTTEIVATRVSCGEALRCGPSDLRWQVKVRVN